MGFYPLPPPLPKFYRVVDALAIHVLRCEAADICGDEVEHGGLEGDRGQAVVGGQLTQVTLSIVPVPGQGEGGEGGGGTLWGWGWGYG